MDMNDIMVEDDELFSDEDFLDDEEEAEEDGEEEEEDEDAESGEESVEDVLGDIDEDIESNLSDVNDTPIQSQTIPRLTKYERANIIGLRATQIQAGSQPFINIKTLAQITPISIAEEELRQHKLDFLKIKRTLPSGKHEIISLKHLKF